MKRTSTIIILLLITVQIISANNRVFKPAFIREAMHNAASWQINNPKHAPSDWTNAALYIGISKAWEATNDNFYFNELLKLGDTTKWYPHHRWHHADDIAISQVYLDVYQYNPQLVDLEPTRKYLDLQIANGEAYYAKRETRQQIMWWWCDALFMAPQVFVEYGVAANNEAYLKAADYFYKQTYDLLYDKEEHLFTRDRKYLASEGALEPNGKKIFWSRGNGWVLAGLANLLDVLPDNYPNRIFYEELFIEMAASIKNIQPQDGLWRTSLLNPEVNSHGEVSGSAFFIYAIAWGIRNGILPSDPYLPCVQKGWSALVNCQNSNGKVGFVQPIGEKPSFKVTADTWEVYGTGAFLAAGSEVLQLSSKEKKKKTVNHEEALIIDMVPSSFPVDFALFTSSKMQFVAYYDTSHQMILASRKLKSTKWKQQGLDSKIGWDSHNSIALHVDYDGYIHIAGNMHASPLIYFRSLKPYDVTSMQAIHTMTGEEETSVTYPEFLTSEKGDLMFHYRSGRSGSGFEVFNKWNALTKKWTPLLNKPIIDGKGEMSAYLQGPFPGPDNNYHLSWVWRNTADCATNHTLSYARSTNLINWISIKAEDTTLPITIAQQQFYVDTIKPGEGLINNGVRLGFDSQGKVIIVYHKYDQRGNTQLFATHYKKNKWVTKQLTQWNYRWDFKGTGTVENKLKLEIPEPFIHKGQMKLAYSHFKYGHGQIIFDEESLEPITSSSFVNDYPGQLATLISSNKDMQVNTIADKGITGSEKRYILRWETMPPSRDKKIQGNLPTPSKLMLIEYQLKN